mmetsp:Transcript_30850/g.108512  ORF Transcript_30850/g.108512 Transcript_30850/m.108512 type:complete len:172 (+) Transcript_30850:39-554(+)
MECTFGLVGDGFVIVAADCMAARSIVVFKQDEDKVIELDSHRVLGVSGTGADNMNFTEYVQKNLALYQINSGLKLSTKATANFIRGELATALRKGCANAQGTRRGRAGHEGSETSAPRASGARCRRAAALEESSGRLCRLPGRVRRRGEAHSETGPGRRGSFSTRAHLDAV